MDNLTVVELHLKIQTENAGGVFRGVQKGHAELGLEPLVLFDDAETPKNLRSTMALKMSDFSTKRVRESIHQQRVQYAAFAEKAATFVFRNFAQQPAAPVAKEDSLAEVA
jgi:hypothetical protein